MLWSYIRLEEWSFKRQLNVIAFGKALTKERNHTGEWKNLEEKSSFVRPRITQAIKSYETMTVTPQIRLF
jgi:hypothetical protein